MLSVIRWIVMSVVFHLAIANASYRALKSPREAHALQLLCLLGVLLCISYLPVLSFICSFIPLFLELRALIAWLLVTLDQEQVSSLFNRLWIPITFKLEDVAAHGVIVRHRAEMFAGRAALRFLEYLIMRKGGAPAEQQRAMKGVVSILHHLEDEIKRE